MYWLISGTKPPLWLLSLSNFLLNYKFLLFFRVFPSFGKYFIIIVGVAKEVFPFLVVLWFIVLGFAHAFFILLRSDDPIGNSNNFNSTNSDATSLMLIKTPGPDLNANMFNWFSTSLLAMYLFLAGNHSV